MKYNLTMEERERERGEEEIQRELGKERGKRKNKIISCIKYYLHHCQSISSVFLSNSLRNKLQSSSSFNAFLTSSCSEHKHFNESPAF